MTIRFNKNPGLFMNPPIIEGRVHNLRDDDMHVQAIVDVTYGREDKEKIERFAIAVEQLMDNALSPKGGRLVKKALPVMQFHAPQLVTPAAGPQKGDILTNVSTGDGMAITRVDCAPTLTIGKMSKWGEVVESRAFWFTGGIVLGASLLLGALVLLAVFGG